MDRRSFVQFCVGAGLTGAVAASAFSMAKPLAIPRLGSSVAVPYFGAHRTAGPAPRGLPLIPIQLNADGAFEGRPIVPVDIDGNPVENAGVDEAGIVHGTNVLDWYKFCGHAGAPGLTLEWPDEDNVLEYFISEEKAAVINPWYNDLLEQPMRPADFPDNEFGAGFRWRSEGQGGANVLTGVLIRFKTRVMRHKVTELAAPAKPLTEAQYQAVLGHYFVEVGDSTFAACSTFCTHFCCIPGYKEAEKLARPRNAWDKIFCTCHNSVYDLREPTFYNFFPEVAKEGAGDGGGGGGH